MIITMKRKDHITLAKAMENLILKNQKAILILIKKNSLPSKYLNNKIELFYS